MGSVSSIPSDDAAKRGSYGSSRRGGETEPTRPLSPELTAAIARAYYLWAKRYRPDLLKEFA